MAPRLLKDRVTSFNRLKERDVIYGWRDFFYADLKFNKVHLSSVGKEHIDAIASHLRKIECAKTGEEFVRVLFSNESLAKTSLRQHAFKVASRISGDLQERGYMWRVHQIYYFQTCTQFGALNRAGDVRELSQYMWSFFIYDLRPITLLDLTGNMDVHPGEDPGL